MRTELAELIIPNKLPVIDGSKIIGSLPCINPLLTPYSQYISVNSNMVQNSSANFIVQSDSAN